MTTQLQPQRNSPSGIDTKIAQCEGGIGDERVSEVSAAAPTVNKPASYGVSSTQPPTLIPRKPPALPPRQESLLIIEEKLKKAINDLTEERRLHSQTKADLQKKEQDAGKYQKQWIQTVNELDRFLRQNQSFNQMTDDQIHQKGRQLRNEIRNFVIQHFDNIKDPKISSGLVEELNSYLRLPQGATEAYLRSPTMRPAVIRAYLWAFIHRRIFDYRFRWAPNRAHKAMSALTDFFEPLWNNKEREDVDAIRKYHMWRANTSNLVLETMALHNEETLGRRDAVNEDAGRLLHHLRDLTASKSQILEEYLRDIIKQSLELDEELSKQVARVTWESVREELPCPFDPNFMILEGGQKHIDDDQVILVLAPGLVKTGKSSGDDFDIETLLMMMEVVCWPRGNDLAGSSSRAQGDTVRGSSNKPGFVSGFFDKVKVKGHR